MLTRNCTSILKVYIVEDGSRTENNKNNKGGKPKASPYIKCSYNTNYPILIPLSDEASERR